MLDSSTTVAMNTDIPLFGFKIHLPSSSCGMEAALVIQRPTPEASFFSWSDFPMVVEESSSPYHTTSASFSSSSCDDASSSLSPSSASASSASLCSLASSSFSSSSSSSTTSLSSTGSSLSDISSTSSRLDLLDDNANANANENTVSRKRRQQTNNNNKNVRFSQHLQVRTYNLVLGDHPLCNDGLAIEMGWEYDSEQGEKIDLQLHEDCKFHPGVQGYGGYYHSPSSNNNNFRSSSQRRTRNYNNTFSCSRRSHLDRKRLLLEVAGCTTEELEDRTNTFQEEEQRLYMLQKQQHLAHDI